MITNIASQKQINELKSNMDFKKIKVLTRAEYDALPTKAADTLYIIKAN